MLPSDEMTVVQLDDYLIDHPGEGDYLIAQMFSEDWGIGVTTADVFDRRAFLHAWVPGYDRKSARRVLPDTECPPPAAIEADVERATRAWKTRTRVVRVCRCRVPGGKGA